MFFGLITFNAPKISLGRISSGLTALAASGLLVFAIMDNNGGRPDAQARWKDADRKNFSYVDRLGPELVEEWRSGQDGVDTNITNSLIKKPETRGENVQEPSVLSLIRENADVAPAVSSGTDRVSVIVKHGDTLYAIARRHGLQVSEIARLNSLQEPYVIRIGQTLYVAR